MTTYHHLFIETLAFIIILWLYFNQMKMVEDFNKELLMKASEIRYLNGKLTHLSLRKDAEDLGMKSIDVGDAIDVTPNAAVVTGEHSSNLDSYVTTGIKRQHVELIIGIPTIHRSDASYCADTIRSLLSHMNDEEREQVVLVIFDADIDSVAAFDSVKSEFINEINSGIIEVVKVPKSLYPSLKNLKRNYGDSESRVYWRSKQNLDFSFLMDYCANRSKFYMQLEDDIVTSTGFVTKVLDFSNRQPGAWYMLDFSSLGFIGKLFHGDDIHNLSVFFRMFYDEQPVDWLLPIYLQVRLQNKRLFHKPSLFQHIGKKSSLDGKIQNLKDKSFVSV